MNQSTLINLLWKKSNYLKTENSVISSQEQNIPPVGLNQADVNKNHNP